MFILQPMDNPSPARKKRKVVSGLHPSSKMPGMNNIHCLQVTGDESMAKMYYYMVSISYSFLAESKEAALQRVDEATKISPGKHISGHFTLRHFRQPYYHITSSYMSLLIQYQQIRPKSPTL